MHISVDVHLECGERNEGGNPLDKDDEIYVFSGAVINGVSQGDPRLSFEGDMNKGEKKFSGPFRTFEGDVGPDGNLIIPVTVAEEDDDGKGRGFSATQLALQKLVQASAGAAATAKLGALAGIVAAGLAGIAFGGIFLNTSDHIGAFTVVLTADRNGRVSAVVVPNDNATFWGTRLVCTGGGAQYFPGVDINGRRVPDSNSFTVTA